MHVLTVAVLLLAVDLVLSGIVGIGGFKIIRYVRAHAKRISQEREKRDEEIP